MNMPLPVASAVGACGGRDVSVAVGERAGLCRVVHACSRPQAAGQGLAGGGGRECGCE